MAIIVVTLPPSVNVDMTTTDTIQFVFDEDGLFCSKDGDDFDPALPHGHEFKAGHTWPNKKDYPDGATPSGDFDAKYSFQAGTGHDCDDLRGIPMQTIHVGS